MESTRKAFDKDGQEIPYAIYEGDFTWEVPVGYTLRKVSRSKKLPSQQPQTVLAGEQRDDGRLRALDKCRSRPKGRTESGV